MPDLVSTNHPAEHGIMFDVIMAAHLHTKADLKPFSPTESGIPPFGKGWKS
jgi:hypothetical protein